ncbi:hypothetical protein PK98_06675 [Croceibacterium mercuriale]|uniref:Uncharacterized protein n=1 Tax=Croceibacterium mercuriale TaxID=1572751 RepID=A0A0B2C1P1_9SPHN|nr:hypothetical protein [Croceibacterium mercuriale]KHL26177.1 hypothetical protein PK98_06675 [Croceibacterium mercuriale]
MFMDFREPPMPPPWRPRPRPARLTRRQEKRLGMVLLANVVLMFAAAPLAGSSVVAALLWMTGS